jgi:hypothetical protein
MSKRRRKYRKAQSYLPDLLATEETHLREATRVAGRATFAVFKQNIITDKKERKS